MPPDFELMSQDLESMTYQDLESTLLVYVSIPQDLDPKISYYLEGTLDEIEISIGSLTSDFESSKSALEFKFFTLESMYEDLESRIHDLGYADW